MKIFLKNSYKSSFLETQILRCISHSKDLELSIKDLRRQLSHTISLNQRLALSKTNPAQIHNELLRYNLTAYKNEVN
jgi:hypothetical protein